MKTFPSDEQAFLLPGPAGDLEVLTTVPKAPSQKVVLICHPHPLYQGTMHNKVVYTIARAFNELGYKTARFNYRGVGESQGVYDEGLGETEDALAIADWVKTVCPDHEISIAGFSFGTYVAAGVANQLIVKELLTVAPSVEHFDFMPFEHIHCPWLVVQGEEDEVVSTQAVYDFCEQNKHRLELVKVPNCNHFFDRRLVDLRKIIVGYFSHG